MHRFLCFLFLLIIYNAVAAQPKTDELLAGILRTSGNTIVDSIIKHPSTFRCQIIYTQINRDKKNKPTFTNYYFNYDPQLYFNPASIVKLPLAFLSLEKLNSLSKYGITKFTTIQYDSSYAGQKALYIDTTATTGRPSIAHFIKRAFLISENDPYNRMYQFVGQQEINRNLHKKGYKDTRITRQFTGFTSEQNRHTNGVRFINENGSLIYAQPPGNNTDSFDFSHKILLGKAHWNRRDSLINAPFDFTEHNNIPLEDYQQILQSVIFPESVKRKQRFNLTADDYTFLYQYLSQFPSETPDPKYDTSKFYDSYVKFFFRNSSRRMPPGVRVFNKVGWSYGFLTDASYVVDFANGIEYMLTATVYVNNDEVLNDGKYEYNTLGYPYMYGIGQAVYNYELQRARTFKPDLSKFKMVYEHRDPSDKRPSLKDVDN